MNPNALAWVFLRSMEGSILELLDEHNSLADEQIAAHLQETVGPVRAALEQLRVDGYVGVLAVGALEGQLRPVGYWSLTDEGREEARRR
jgi:predicted ArsR family transcriptional regulator